MTEYDCKKGKHEFEWIYSSVCGCEIEVCYRCDHELLVVQCEWCKEAKYGSD